MDGSGRFEPPTGRQNVAIVGSGIAGMSAAWLLSQGHDVTVFERNDRIGGHSNTIDAPTPKAAVPVDTGFIVYNDVNYPNLVALFEHLGVPTQPSVMSFSASIGDGRVEYAGTNIGTFFAQKRNLFRPAHWRMMADIIRFYRDASAALHDPATEELSLGEFLDARTYSDSFARDHLLPMGAAIWSTETGAFRAHSAAAFIRFFENHGLLRLSNRPQWRTVTGGSREYVQRLTAAYHDKIRLNQAARRIDRQPDGVIVENEDGQQYRFDHVIIAAHADEALAMLSQPTPEERALLGCFHYQTNRAVVHSDPALMPKRRSVWSSWNYLRPDEDRDDEVCVTYWMNQLQSIDPETPLFVTLNPCRPPRPETIIHSFDYEHPVFDVSTLKAQRKLWDLQGTQRTWFCGSYFGAGFHEDGLQSGLAVAEALSGLRRPWSVEGESNRIHLTESREAAE